MSDDTMETVPVSSELRTWARTVLEQHRAVVALHAPTVRWVIPDLPETSFDSEQDALAWGDEGEMKPEDLQTFTVCAECSRMERETLEQQSDEWGYMASQWPCRTAVAIGVG